MANIAFGSVQIFGRTIVAAADVAHGVPQVCGTVVVHMGNPVGDAPNCTGCERPGAFRGRIRRTAPPRFVWLCAEHTGDWATDCRAAAA